MPGTNGMDAAEQIRKRDAQVVIMFITNMAHYAIKGYEVVSYTHLDVYKRQLRRCRQDGF